MIMKSIVRSARLSVRGSRKLVWRRPACFAAVLSCALAACPPVFAEGYLTQDEMAAGEPMTPSSIGAPAAIPETAEEAFGEAEGAAPLSANEGAVPLPSDETQADETTLGEMRADSSPEAGDAAGGPGSDAGDGSALSIDLDEAESVVDETGQAAGAGEPERDTAGVEAEDAEAGETAAEEADAEETNAEEADSEEADTEEADTEEVGAGEADPDAGDEGTDGPVFQALETSQEAVARTVVNLSRAMDRMLGAREVYPDEEYDSILRVRFFQRLDDSGGSRFEPRVSGRVSLPGAEKRWSVIFFSDDYEDPVDRERGTDRELDESSRGSVALRYLMPLRDRAKTSLSVGLRTGPVDMILRGRLWYEFDAGKLSIRPEQTLFWYDERGLGASSWLRFEYPLPRDKLLRSESGATWFKRDERFYYDQIFSLLQPLSRKRGLLWQIGMQAESRPNAHVTHYYAQVRWRSLVHRDWLIFEMRPQLFSDRANDFHFEHRLYIGFELLFGDAFRVR
jgi:hypothetical protein